MAARRKADGADGTRRAPAGALAVARCRHSLRRATPSSASASASSSSSRSDALLLRRLRRRAPVFATGRPCHPDAGPRRSTPRRTGRSPRQQRHDASASSPSAFALVCAVDERLELVERALGAARRPAWRRALRRRSGESASPLRAEGVSIERRRACRVGDKGRSTAASPHRISVPPRAPMQKRAPPAARGVGRRDPVLAALDHRLELLALLASHLDLELARATRRLSGSSGAQHGRSSSPFLANSVKSRGRLASELMRSCRRRRGGCPTRAQARPPAAAP